MSGKRLKTQTRSQQRAGGGSVSTRTRNAGTVRAKRKRVTVSSMSGSTSASPSSVVAVSLEDLEAARNAFNLKYSSMPKQTPKRRRTLQEPLTNCQKCKLVDRYIAARKRNENVDYKDLSTKVVFRAFIGHPGELKKHGDKLLQELYQIYEQDHEIDRLEPITTSPVAAAAEAQPSTGEKPQAREKKDRKEEVANILQRFCQLYEDDQEQVNQLKSTTTPPVAAATEVQPSTGEEVQEEHQVATPAFQCPEKVNLTVAVALQKVQMAEALLKEAQTTLRPVKD